MNGCIERGLKGTGLLPGVLKVRRRAARLHRMLVEAGGSQPLHVMDWVNAFALAVNEENAAGGRVVTAPTNGAAGIVPAVIAYYRRFEPGASDEGILVTARRPCDRHAAAATPRSPARRWAARARSVACSMAGWSRR
jgi:L-serine dehydratase